jgi:integrase
VTINLYLRHRQDCEAGYPEDFRSGEFEERKKGWKRCACLIFASGTFAGKFKRKSTGLSDFEKARELVSSWKTWDGEIPSSLPAATTASKVTIGRAVSRHGSCWGRGISENVVWYVVRQCAKRLGLEHIAPHDLRRTCAKLCHSNGGELEQIQFLLGHGSVLTTERYLGSKQNLEEPVNNRFGPLYKRETPTSGEPDIAR